MAKKSKQWPKSVTAKCNGKDVEILPLCIEDTEQWFKIVENIFSSFGDDVETVEMSDFYKKLLSGKNIKTVLNFIICRKRTNEKGTAELVNKDITDHDIRQMDYMEAVNCVEALTEVTEVATLLGKVQGLWNQMATQNTATE
jgi:hypothetical protein